MRGLNPLSSVVSHGLPGSPLLFAGVLILSGMQRLRQEGRGCQVRSEVFVPGERESAPKWDRAEVPGSGQGCWTLVSTEGKLGTANTAGPSPLISVSP